MSSPGTTVEQCSRPLHPTVWLEVGYWGTTPPLALFADLEMIGWRPPVPAAPPSEAIDWDAPDPTTGERFTIRPWRVERAVVEPPRGSGSRGHWTAADREAFLLPLHGVLRRHGLLEEPTPPTAPDRPAPPEASDPAPRPEGSDPQRAPSGSAVVRAELPATADRQRVADALAPLGLAAHVVEETKAVRTTYRGTPFESRVPVVRAEVLVDAERAGAVADALRGLGLEPTVDGSGPETAPAEPAGRPGTRRAWVLVDPGRAEEARAALVACGATSVSATPATLVLTSTYRGTSFDQEHPAVRVAGDLPGGTAARALAEACTALGLDRDDEQRAHLGPVVPLSAVATQGATVG